MTISVVDSNKEQFSAFGIAFLDAYPIEGWDYDPVTQQLTAYDSLHQSFFPRSLYASEEEPYLLSLFARLTSLFGLPNAFRKNESNGTFGQILKNMIYYPLKDDLSSVKRVIAILFSWMTIPFGIISIVAKAFFHIFIKPITEFLPRYLELKCQEKIKKLDDAEDRTFFKYTLPIGLLKTGEYFFGYLWYPLGRAITSPIKGIKAAWKFSKATFEKHPVLRAFVGISLVLISLAIAAVVYIALPLVLTLLAVLVAGWVLHVSGGIVATAIAKFVSTHFPVVTDIIRMTKADLTFIIAPILNAMHMHAAYTGLVVRAAFIAILKGIKDTLLEIKHTSKLKQFAESVVVYFRSPLGIIDMKPIEEDEKDEEEQANKEYDKKSEESSYGGILTEIKWNYDKVEFRERPWDWKNVELCAEKAPATPSQASNEKNDDKKNEELAKELLSNTQPIQPRSCIII